MKPKTSLTPTSPIFAKESKTIDNADVSAGLNFNISPPTFMQFPSLPTLQQYLSARMTFNGHVSIPAGLGLNSQVLIYFYFNNNGRKGNFIGSVNPATRTLKGQAVINTVVVPLQPNVSMVNEPISLSIAYSDLNVPKGYPHTPITTHVIAEPVLLIDGFPIKIGRPLPFPVNL